MKTSHVFDTYVKTSTGRPPHFDIVFDDKEDDKALAHAQIWLKSIGEEQTVVTQKNCIFCHSAEVSTEFRK